MKTETSDRLTTEPLTKDNWAGFVELFGEKGACGNCWCMFCRLGNKEYQSGKTDQGNKKAMKKIVWEGRPAGLLGFVERAGFEIVDRTSKNRPMVRYYL